MQIRNAEHKDLLQLILLGEKFFNETHYKDSVTYNPESVHDIMSNLIDGEYGVLLVAEDKGNIVGMIGGVIIPFYFNHNYTTAQELFWYVLQANRKGGVGEALLDAYEKTVKQLGCDMTIMASLSTNSTVDKFYANHAYKPTEQFHMKEL